MRKNILVHFIFLFFALPLQASPETKLPVQWQKWDESIFQKAKSEKKFVILDLEAVWCHWCHVMEETTYQDPKVVALIQSKYIPVRVDQDANPDISHRYEDYGWPATIVFGSDGGEIVKRRGYIPPDRMASLLQAIIDDPTPGPSIQAEEEVKPAENAFLSPEQSKKILEEHLGLYDTEFGGWGSVHKLMDADAMEYAILKGQEGDGEEEKRALRTLDQTLNLLDPVWGGFYQYSDERNWKSPHFEKIMFIQSDYMRLYSMAWLIWQKPEYLNAAKAIAGYVKNFLTSPEGAFYTSQDADLSAKAEGNFYYAFDDAGRRKLGLPRIDQHRYARENGWMIASLTGLYAASGEEAYLQQAISAAHWVESNRSFEGGPNGGFRHDEKDRNGPYLGDTLSMARAFLALYGVTSERLWLEKSEAAAKFIKVHFEDAKSAGFVTAPVPANAVGALQKPVKKLDENIAIARFMNLLFHYTGNADYKKSAENAMRYLASPAIINHKRFLTGIGVADRELANEPPHFTVVGPKKDPKAKELFLAASRYPAFYKRVEWWDRKEGLMPNPDVRYPELQKPAAFICAFGRCSLPIFDSAKLPEAIQKFKKGSLKS